MVLRGPRTGLELKFFELTQTILADLGLKLYDLDWHGPSGDLKVYIVNPETNTAVLEDCVKVDRAYNPYVETESWIPENLVLEVSSPGLFRQLTALWHFRDVVGQDVTLSLAKKIDEAQYPDFPKVLRNNQKIKVKLESVSERGVVVEAKGVKVEIPFEQIKKANLETDFNNPNNNYQPE
jgi:ribosome maturation factor RimP